MMDNDLQGELLIHGYPEQMSCKGTFHEQSHLHTQGYGSEQHHQCEHNPFGHAMKISQSFLQD